MFVHDRFIHLGHIVLRGQKSNKNNIFILDERAIRLDEFVNRWNRYVNRLNEFTIYKQAQRCSVCTKCTYVFVRKNFYDILICPNLIYLFCIQSNYAAERQFFMDFVVLSVNQLYFKENVSKTVSVYSSVPYLLCHGTPGLIVRERFVS